MKIFVPMSDATVGDNGEFNPGLVPFDPSFLAPNRPVLDGNKPRNWVSDCDRQQAKARLYATQA